LGALPMDPRATIEAELRADVALAQIVRFDLDQPLDRIVKLSADCWLDLCLAPRVPEVRASYTDRWGAYRYERLGDVFIKPPSEAMRIRCEAGSTRSLVCQLKTEAIAQWFDGDLEWTDGRLKAGLEIPDPGIRGLLARLAQETQNPGFASQILLELIAGQLAIELGRYCASDVPVRGGLSASRLRLIDERLRAPGKAPTLAELAALCNLSVRQLSRGFHASRNCSIGCYIEQSRIESAKKLLLGGQPIKSIAYSMGFSSPSSFSYAFRRATGMRPNAFRQHA
jgi:AraC family transcriptional regulator